MSKMLLFQTVPWAGTKWLEDGAEYTLIGMAIVIAVIILSKYLRFSRSRRASALYAPEVAKAFKKQDWNEALAISEKYSEQAHLARVVLIGLKERENLKEKLPVERIEKHMDEAMEREIMAIHFEHMENLGIVDAIGITSPFIGALGASAMAFAFGIILAVPTIWFATYLRNKTLLLEVDMKTAASELTTILDTYPDAIGKGV